MGEINVRLIVEAVIVTTAFIGVGLAGLYAYVSAQRRTPDAVAELTASYDELARMVRTLQRDREHDHEVMIRVQLRMAELEIGVRILIAQVKREGLTPEWTPPPPVPADKQDGDHDTALPPIIAALFDIDEIDDLALRLGVDAGKIDGNTTDKRARALVAYLQRRGRVDELIALARQLRPDGGI